MAETEIDNIFKSGTVNQDIARLESLLNSHVHDGRETRNVNTNSPTITSGTAAPTTTPKKVGDIFIRTDTGKAYFAKGTSSSSDWFIVN